MQLVAIKKLKYGRTVYAAGERFEATQRDAQVLIATKLADQWLETVVPVEVIPPARKRGRYQTRDMRAS